MAPLPETHQREEEEDSLSLSDFPRADPISEVETPNHPTSQHKKEEEEEEFEFLAGGGAATQESMNMCSAEEVFFNGQLLPLRASRSETLERSSSNSLSCSSVSSRMSRSHSTDSSTSTGSESRRLSISSNFYAHPSPKPCGLSATNKVGGGTAMARRRRRSSSMGGSTVGLFGVARVPEIELEDLRVRSMRRRSTGERKPEKKMGKLWLLGKRFACSCSVGEVIEPTNGKEEEAKEGRTLRSSSSCSSSSSCKSSRTFQWLEDLNSSKNPMLC